MSNDPVTAANGTTAITLEAGTVLNVSGSNGTRGSITILNGNSVESSDKIVDAQTKAFGPYGTRRTARLYSEAGRLAFNIASILAALPQLQSPTISADGKTISGVGVKPNSPVPVYNVDTGIALGSVTSAADGSWSLALKAAVNAGDRIGYDPTIIGPHATAGVVVAAPGQVTGLTLGTATNAAQSLTWAAPTDGGAPTGYTIEFRRQGDSAWSQAAAGVTGTGYTVTGLTAATPYQYRVTATNATGAGTPSAVASGSTAATPPAGTDGSADFSNPANSGLHPAI